VYAEVFPPQAAPAAMNQHRPRGYILSGGPNSIYEPGAPQLPWLILEAEKPVLGICYGMQALTHALRGQVAAAQAREYGAARITQTVDNPLLDGLLPTLQVWMSHGDRIEAPPP